MMYVLNLNLNLLSITEADSGWVGARGVRAFRRKPLWLNTSILWKILDKFDKIVVPFLPWIFTHYISLPSSLRRLFDVLILKKYVKLLDDWQTVKTQIRCRVQRRLIWVYTVCSGLSFWIRWERTIIWSNRNPQKSPSIRPCIYIQHT